MADKDEVEPTDGTGSTPASDATPEPSDVVDAPKSDAVPADLEPVDLEPVEVADDEFDDSDRGELEPAGVVAVPAAGAAGSSALARERVQARKAKEAATRRRDQLAKPERTGPVKFVKESIGELRKVVYPTGQQLMSYFVVVLVFVLFIIAYVGLLDLGLGWVLFRVFGGKA